MFHVPDCQSHVFRIKQTLESANKESRVLVGFPSRNPAAWMFSRIHVPVGHINGSNIIKIHFREGYTKNRLERNSFGVSTILP